MQRLNIEFIQQFKEQDVKLPVISQRNGNIFLRCYTNKKKERHPLGKFLEKKIGHVDIISGLIARLENEDLVLSRRLIRYMEGMLDAFSDDIRKEPYSATYYRSLSVEIRQFREFMCSSENPHVVLYNRLINLPCSANTHSFMIALKESAEVMSAYHDIFANLVQQESEKMGKVLVTSRIGQRLYKLSLVVESLILATRSTYAMVVEWQKRIKCIQREEIYN